VGVCEERAAELLGVVLLTGVLVPAELLVAELAARLLVAELAARLLAGSALLAAACEPASSELAPSKFEEPPTGSVAPPAELHEMTQGMAHVRISREQIAVKLDFEITSPPWPVTGLSHERLSPHHSIAKPTPGEKNGRIFCRPTEFTGALDRCRLYLPMGTSALGNPIPELR
jgi:hypothetical protein